MMFAALLLVALVLRTLHPATAHNEDVATSPLVGSWIVTSTDPHGPEFPALMSFHSDGTASATTSEKLTGYGEWEITDDGTVAFTYVTLGPDGSIEGGTQYVVTGGIVVSTDGNSWKTDDVTGPEGKRISLESVSHQVDSPSINATI
jgi:hypothetical protein